jgi:hypothetical protein
MRKTFLLVAAALAWCELGLSAAHAQSAYEANFDTTFPTFGYGYSYSGYGSPPDYTAIDSTAQTPSTWNVTTPPAATATINTTNWMIPPEAAYTYAGVGLGIGFFLPEDMRPTSGDLSQYTVSFDIKVEGYAPLDDGLPAKVQIIFQGPGFQADEYSIGVNDQNLGQFPAVPQLTSTFQNFSHPLSDFAFIGGAWDFPTLFAGTTQILVQVEPYLTPGSANADEIGLDNDNVLTIDNVRIEGPFGTAVPGDYDGDSDVDGDDFLIWQRGQSPNGMVPGDLTAWKDNFGTAPAGATTAIPEPGALALAATALALAASRRRRA